MVDKPLCPLEWQGCDAKVLDMCQCLMTQDICECQKVFAIHFFYHSFINLKQKY